MTTKSEDVPVCNACGRTSDDHTGMRHPFSPKGASTSWLKPQKIQAPDVRKFQQEMETRPSSPPPFDPVLRQALIAKGVITAEELADADKLIRALGLGGALSGSAESQESPPGV